MNASLKTNNLYVASLAFAILSFAASFLVWPMQIMLSTDRFGAPSTAPFGALLASVCLLVVASWISLFVAFTNDKTEIERISSYGWSASILAVNGLTCAFIVLLVASVWRDLDSIGAARVSRALVVVASTQFFVAVILVFGMLNARIQPATSSSTESSED